MVLPPIIARRADAVVCAWYGVGGILQRRADQVRALLLNVRADAKTYYLGLTGGGEPRHPLHVAGETPPQPYRFGHSVP